MNTPSHSNRTNRTNRTNRSILTVRIASLFALCGIALASDWVGGASNDWNTGSNWSGGVVVETGSTQRSIFSNKHARSVSTIEGRASAW